MEIDRRKERPMNEKPSRQQQRENARKVAKDTSKLIEAVEGALGELHYRIEVLTEAVRLSGGVTAENMLQAEKNVIAKAQAATKRPAKPKNENGR